MERKRVSAVNAAKHNSLQRPANHQRYGHEIQHNDVLAQVMFGMWKDLLPNHTAEASKIAAKNLNRDRLWDDALRGAFPHILGPDGSVTFWRVSDLHRLRNRVSHMEPLLDENLQPLPGMMGELVLISLKFKMAEAPSIVQSKNIRLWNTTRSKCAKSVRSRGSTVICVQ